MEAATGKYLWHFQTVHHDIWDLDLPAATLVDVKKNGRAIPAIADHEQNRDAVCTCSTASPASLCMT